LRVFQNRTREQKIRLLLLLLLLGASISLFLFTPVESEKSLFQNVMAGFDDRPVQRILFIGNSRTYVNNLPKMVEQMGNASKSPFRYEVAMHALGGHTFEDHHQNGAVHQLLEQPWDYVVLQGGSPENTNPGSSESFAKHGAELVALVQKSNSQPVFLVAWAYDKDAYDSENEIYLKPYYLEYAADYQAYVNKHQQPPADRPAPETFFPLNLEKHDAFIQHDYSTLAAQTQTPMVNVGEAFQHVLNSPLHFKKLTSDGNHPNLQGTYLGAVMFHVCFSKMPASSIQYTPSGLSENDAKAIRLFIDLTYPNGTC